MNTTLARSVLAVGVEPLPPSTPDLEICVAPSAREAFAMLRLLHFDVLFVGRAVRDQSMWWLIRRVLLAWPQQRWILVACDVTVEEEVLARSLGSSLILEVVPDGARLYEIVQSLLGRKLHPVAGWSPKAAGSCGRVAEEDSVTTGVC